MISKGKNPRHPSNNSVFIYYRDDTEEYLISDNPQHLEAPWEPHFEGLYYQWLRPMARWEICSS